MTGFAQTDLLCANCGGQCRFTPADVALKCDSCTQLHPILVDPEADPSREFHYNPDLPHTEQTVWSRLNTQQCETCGGSVTFAGPVLSDRCSYCDGPVVLKESELSYDAFGVIPFRMVEAEHLSAARTWVEERIAAPGDLYDAVEKGRITGLYVPFWTFDSNEAIEYYVKYLTKRGKKWTINSDSGDLFVVFDDLLMPASLHVTPLIRDGILHDFNPDVVRPYDPAYLAGFGAEQHHQSVTEGLEANESDKDLLIRNHIKRRSSRSKILSISYKTHTSGIHYRRILLPVWICHYSYGGEHYKIVTSGIDGRTYGERPHCPIKLFAISAACTLGIMAIGWAWGAIQVLS